MVSLINIKETECRSVREKRDCASRSNEIIRCNLKDHKIDLIITEAHSAVAN